MENRVKACFVPMFLVVFALMLGLAVTGCGDNDDSKEDEKTIDIDLEVSEAMTTIEKEDLGVPLYPGAELQSEEVAVRVTTGPEGKWQYIGAVLVTSDEVSVVTEWYRNELSSKERFADMSYEENGEPVGMFDFLLGEEERTLIIKKERGSNDTLIAVDMQKELD